MKDNLAEEQEGIEDALNEVADQGVQDLADFIE
jgi:hypothetical protein